MKIMKIKAHYSMMKIIYLELSTKLDKYIKETKIKSP